MTCIVGMLNENKIYVGADNAGCTESIHVSRDDDKVFIKDEMIIGCTTSFRMINLLRYQFNRPLHDPRKTVDEYIYTDWIEDVRKLFKEKGFSTINNNVETGGNFILGYKGNLYEIDNDFQVAKPKNPFCCVGSGMFFAYGAMRILIKDVSLKPDEILTQALEVAEEYNPFVRGPFKILNI